MSHLSPSRSLSPSLSVLSKSNHLLFSLLFIILHYILLPSPDPYYEPKISRDICRPAERKTASKEKDDIFFTLRNLSWWLLQSATESFWQKLLRIGKQAYGDEEIASENSCTVKVIQFDQGYMYCFGIVTVAAVKVQIYKSFLDNKRKMSSSPNISLRIKYHWWFKGKIRLGKVP